MRRLGPGLALALLGLACDRTGSSGSSTAKDTTCPPCECAGANTSADSGTDSSADSGADSGGAGPLAGEFPGEIAELVASASRKLAHGDGQGCLADLDRVSAIAPKYAGYLEIQRAQCRMLIGECQEGKQTLIDWYMREQAFTRELAQRTAESIASMRCRGGDATERDRLLAALFDLQDGAYMNKRDVAWCRDRVALVEQLAPKVTPRDAEDTQVTGGIQALFHTSAMCFARAGDCATSYAYYRRLFPREGLDAVKDAKMREKVVRDSFDSTIVLCQPNQPQPSPSPSPEGHEAQ